MRMVAFSEKVRTLIPDLPEGRLPWLRRVHLAKARMILPEHIPAERVERAGGPTTPAGRRRGEGDDGRRPPAGPAVAPLRTFLAGSIPAAAH